MRDSQGNAQMPDLPVDDLQNTESAGPTSWPILPEPGMLDRIIAIIAKEAVIAPELIKPDSTLDTLGLVSIDVVNILMGVEEEFDTYVPMSNELQEVRNLHDLIKVVAEQMAREAAEKAAAKG